jgi:hypothetical protein
MEERTMLELDQEASVLHGPKGSIPLPAGDEVARKFLMLIEGQCMGLGATRAARKYGYCKQRYFQLLDALKQGGAGALKNKKRGPKTNYRRTGEVVRQVIRHRFLDPDASPEVIAQKLRQCGLTISIRSVRRVVEEYGLQKKTLRLSAGCQGG